MSTETTQEYTCEFCKEVKSGKKTKSISIPNGWKYVSDNKLACRKCVSNNYKIRAISLPIASICPENGETNAGIWAKFRLVFSDTTKQLRRFSNWYINQLYINDPAFNTPQIKDKIPPYKISYLYKEATIAFPHLDTQMIVLVQNNLNQRYKSKRLMMFLGKESLASFQRDLPIPSLVKSSKSIYEKDGRFYVTITINKGNRFTLQLRGGKEFRKHIFGLRKLLSGKAVPKQILLHEISGGRSDHRPLLSKSKRLNCRITGLFPIDNNPVINKKVLNITTCPDSLMRYVEEGSDKDKRYNADHIKRLVMQHRNRLDRTTDDIKFCPKFSDTRDKIINSRSPWLNKFHNRMDNECHQVSNILINYSTRNNYKTIRYDDSIKTYITEFPWYKLKLLIKYKAESAGITFIDSSEPLREITLSIGEHQYEKQSCRSS